MIGHPAQLIVHHRVELDAGDLADRAAGRIADPQFDGVGRGVGKGKALAVGRPERCTRAGIGRQGHGGFTAVGNADQLEALGARRNAVASRGVMLAVVARFYTAACQAQEGGGHAGDGGQFLPGDQQHGVFGRADAGGRQCRGAHDLENVGRGLLVACRLDVRQHAGGNQRQREGLRCRHGFPCYYPVSLGEVSGSQGRCRGRGYPCR